MAEKIDGWSRRRMASAALCGLLMPLSTRSKAFSPRKQIPSPIEYLIPNLALLIAKGRLSRHVFLKRDVAEKIAQGKEVEPSELRLLDIKEFDGIGPLSSYLEVTHHEPLWAEPHSTEFPAYAGTVYYYGVNTEMQLSEIEKLIGRDAIFLISHLEGLTSNGPTRTFPFPLYYKVYDGHWRESIPLPITELEHVELIAKKSGFVKPINIIQANKRS